MTLGEKIRNARIDAHMTQAELAGDCVSRNMMSKIENGKVSPSLRTLTYIAEKLKLPAGYFLNDVSELPDEMSFRENEIRRLFSEGKTDECLVIFSLYDIPSSNEMNFFRAVSYLYRGVRFYNSGKLDDAESDFNSVLIFANETNYPVDKLEKQALIYLTEIGRVELSSVGYKGEKLYESSFRILDSEYEQFEIEKYILALIKKSDFTSAEYLRSELLPEGSVVSRRLKAVLISEIGDLDGAIYIFNELLSDENTSMPQKFISYDYLEELYAEVGNYTDAYRCARKKSEMYSHMKKK